MLGSFSCSCFFGPISLWNLEARVFGRGCKYRFYQQNMLQVLKEHLAQEEGLNFWILHQILRIVHITLI